MNISLGGFAPQRQEDLDLKTFKLYEFICSIEEQAKFTQKNGVNFSLLVINYLAYMKGLEKNAFVKIPNKALLNAGKNFASPAYSQSTQKRSFCRGLQTSPLKISPLHPFTLFNEKQSSLQKLLLAFLKEKITISACMPRNDIKRLVFRGLGNDSTTKKIIEEIQNEYRKPNLYRDPRGTYLGFYNMIKRNDRKLGSFLFCNRPFMKSLLVFYLYIHFSSEDKSLKEEFTNNLWIPLQKCIFKSALKKDAILTKLYKRHLRTLCEKFKNWKLETIWEETDLNCTLPLPILNGCTENDTNSFKASEDPLMINNHKRSFKDLPSIRPFCYR